MSEMTPSEHGLARGMLKAGIVKFGNKKLKDEAESNVYVDVREMISIPGLFNWASSEYNYKLQESDLLLPSDYRNRHLMAVPESGNYFVGAVAVKMGVSAIQHRAKLKKHGIPKPFIGRYEQNDQVVLLDDVIKSGGSKVAEAISLSTQGLEAIGAVVLVDRQQGGKSELEQYGMQLVAVMTLSGIMKCALDENLAGVTQTLYDDIIAELDPAELDSL